MKCANVRPLLEECFEGLIVDRRADAVAAHLNTCAACAAELRQIERIAGALSAVPRTAPARDLVAAVSARIAALPAPRQQRLTAGWRWVGVVAAISVACLAAVSYLLPLLISERLGASIALLGQARDASVLIREWFAVAPNLLLALWLTLGKVWQWFVLAARAAAPTLGMYLAAEIGILAAIVFVLHSRSRRMLVRQTLLV
jgi:predicted anti-sigma-YlaC factor YlaD